MMQALQRQGSSWSDDDDDDENVVVPLVENDDNESSSGVDSSALRQRRRQRLRSLEIAMRQQEDAAYYPTCLGDSWRFVASVILGCILVAPLLLRYYRGGSTFSWPSDDLECAHELDISYSQVYEDISKAASFCKTDESSCDCTSPLIPKFAVDDSEKEQWQKAFDRNVVLANNAKNVDVLLLGDSITEHWQGTSMGKLKYPSIKRVYEELFQSKSTTGIQGLALGISGDRCPQVLYRLHHGEMPLSLKPKVWWVLIGTNDLYSGGCSVLAVLQGIIQIVMEIQRHDANAIVVVNSILPRAGGVSRGGSKLASKLWQDIMWINKHMECYVQADPKLDFFNATDLFLMNNDTRYINETLMPDMLHPSAEGSQVWGTEIVKRVKELIQE